MKLTDNCLSDELFLTLIETVCRENFPWFYVAKTAAPVQDNTDVFDYSWAHYAISDGEDNSGVAQLIRKVYSEAMEKSKENPGTLYRARFGLITALENQKIHEPHIDYDFKHRVGLLYLNSTDGDTILYKARYTDSTIPSEQLKKQNLDFSVEHSIKPVANRFVLFDGNQFHSSSAPSSNSRRIVLNLDILD
jgi:hypothetical protein